ncbi:MAG: class I SAM-dependent methyltransferase [Oligoflexia bacterium]|nr:class I SAM-dependent methyltransferase [Oligoflexia bacterium]
MEYIDQPERITEIRSLIENKASLKKFYIDLYHRMKACLQNCPNGGSALELGSGGGFVKDIISEVITSDIIPYSGVDLVVDASHMPFDDNSLKFIGMINTLHHIPDAESFFKEAQRVLMPGGRILIIDQHSGYISYPILKWAHHEAYDSSVSDWKFTSTGPLSSANGALPWIIFQRDRKKFETLFSNLDIVKYEPHSPLMYWLVGGLKKWSLVPESLYTFFKIIDEFLCYISPNFGSFVSIELKKTK